MRVSSSGHGNSPVVFDDLFFDGRISANALMPGGIWTNLQHHWDPAVMAGTKARVAASGMSAKTPEHGAATSVLLTTFPALRE